jgi:hypothetical protein
MKTVTLRFTDDDARYALYALRMRYNRDGRTGLAKLCKMAVIMEVGAEAERDLAEAEKAYDDECVANARQSSEE